MDPKLKNYFRLFIRDELKTNFTPLSPGDDLTFETWLSNRKAYPEWRKKELEEVHARMTFSVLKRSYRDVNAFVKDECYPEFKFPRGIYARSDYFKILFGPLVSKIEEQIYANPSFVKHVAACDRADYIQEFLNLLGVMKGATDFTSFESSFTEEIMQEIDFVVYDYFTSKLNMAFYKQLYESLGKENTIYYKYLIFYIKAKRMSGEMNTSQANGFANYIVFKFLCWYYGYGENRQTVEGDDGLGQTASGLFPTKEQYAKAGFIVKIDLHQDVSTASFCGNIAHADDRVNIADPMKILADFSWASARYVKCGIRKKKLLLRCKALSFYYQYPRTPIIQELALYGLRMTRSFDVNDFIENNRMMSEWERDRYRIAAQSMRTVKYDEESMRLPIPINTRILMEDKFGVLVEQQLQIESMLRSKTDLSPLEIDINWPDDWRKYFSLFVIDEHEETPNIVLNGGVRAIDQLKSGFNNVSFSVDQGLFNKAAKRC
jgi:hypothetical protein